MTTLFIEARLKDSYLNFSHSTFGKRLFSVLGLTIPPKLSRYKQGDALVKSSILVNSQQSIEHIKQCFDESDVVVADNERHFEPLSVQALIFDATAIETPQQLELCHQFFKQYLGCLQANGRIVVLGKAIIHNMSISCASAQRALVGIIKSLAKEVGRRGCTANLLYTSSVDVMNVAAPLRFFISDKSTYVSGQVITANVSTGGALPERKVDVHAWQKPLQGKTALVTGASRGIGAAIARALAADGAKVIGLDVPQAGVALTQQMTVIDGQSILLDVTASDAPQHIAQSLKQPLDIVVHNAGITRDKMLKRMSLQQWQSVMDINLNSVVRINDYFLENDCLASQAKIVCVASISGIAGNVGQVNYAASKSGIIGLVESTAKHLEAQGAEITINAVAPGFIETEMTAKIPLMTRHFGRRLCSLSQGGLPSDVANTIAFLASPNSQSINGNTLRVCGQNLVGA